MVNKLKKIDKNITNLKIWDESHIYFFDILDNLENFIRRLDEYLPEVVLTKNEIKEYENDLKKWFTKIPIIEYSREFLKNLKKEYSENNKDYPYKNAWELWEILLNVFQKKDLGAIKVVSKIWNRDSIKFNVLWRDTSFVYKDSNNKICMLIWESKLSVNSKDDKWGFKQNSLEKWLINAHDDLNLFYKDSSYLNHEINLARKWLKNEMNDENRDIFVEYFIKDNPKHTELIYKNTIFVWYTQNDYNKIKSWKISENDLIELLFLDINKTFWKETIKSRLSDKNNIYFLLPIECIEKAREYFVNHNNLEYE